MNSTANDFRAKQAEFAAHLRDPDNNPAPADVEDRRMQIYRDIFFNNIKGFLAQSFPVLSAQLGEDRWALLIRDFYRDHRSLSPLFPQVAREFLNYLADERTGKSDGDEQTDEQFLYELAHYEWVALALKLADDPEPDTSITPDGSLLDNQPVFSELAWAMSYSWPVSEFTGDNQPEQPAGQMQHHLVYRDDEGQVVFTKLNAVSARLFQLLDTEGAISGGEALHTVARELQHAEPDKVLASGLQILEKWRELGVIIGTRAA
jgi:hypothetical protein